MMFSDPGSAFRTEIIFDVIGRELGRDRAFAKGFHLSLGALWMAREPLLVKLLLQCPRTKLIFNVLFDDQFLD